MKRSPPQRVTLACLLAALPSAGVAEWTWRTSPTSVCFAWDGDNIGEYVFVDEAIPRPYFANLQTPGGVRVTRNHPPIDGEDRMDHPEFHPGVWFALGDLSGADSWRLRAPVRHKRFDQKPQVDGDAVSFVAEHDYLGVDGEVLAVGRAAHRLRVSPLGVTLTFDETLTAERDLALGDQEEMGLGVRLATPLRIENDGPSPVPPGTGQIVADGGRNGLPAIWGKPARWFDYRGRLGDEPAGVAVFCHPANFRVSRLHARDYGFVCVNPFATAAFGAAEPTVTRVAAGESIQLRFAVLCHSGEPLTAARLEAAYEAYVDSNP